MRTEQKIFNDLIENIVNNSENNEAKITNVELWAKSWKEEMKQALTLTDVGKQLLCLNNEFFEYRLTKGKKYKLIRKDKNCFYIKDDLGNIFGYKKRRFKKL